jgi:acyl-homoserine-lactone acylase
VKKALILFAALSAAALLLVSCNQTAETALFPEPGKVKIVRDDFGVPHIYAANEKDLMFGFGYTVAQDRCRQIFASVLTTEGRLAELNGETALPNDQMVRMFRLRKLASEALPSLSPDQLNLLRSYCSGVNAFIEENRQSLPDYVTTLEPDDVLAMELMINLDFALMSHDSPMADLRRTGVGSNQFAVAPARSASGHALLCLDPHLPFDGMYRWTEAQLCTPQLSVIGAVIPGLPIIGLGHNGKIAWSLTVNYPDLSDLFAEEIDPADPSRYRTADGWSAFEQRNETFKIKTDDGFREETTTFLASAHGPVIKIENGVAYAARVAGLGEPGILKQFYDINHAASVQQAIEAFRTPGFNLQNLVTADTAGNIGYLYNALIPQRTTELDWSKAVPATDPRAQWGPYIPFDELPRIINPASGWLQNCNNSPWYVTTDSGIDPAALPNRLCTIDILGDRGARLTELLSADDSIEFEEMIAYATDTMVLKARLWVPALLEAAQRHPELAGGPTADALNILRDWNYHADSDSTAMTLFYAWYGRGDLSSIRQASDITEDILQMQLIELGAAAADLCSSYGSLDVPWGKILFFRHGEHEFPLSGGGIFNVLRQAWGTPEGQRLSVRGGSSYTMIVELSPTPRAVSCFPCGVSEDPASPHFADITKLYSEKRLKPVWFTPEEVLAHSESTQTIVVNVSAN